MSTALASLGITKTERIVWKRIAEGAQTKQIADEMAVDVRTVDSHRAHLAAKLGARNAADMTRAAVRFGVIVVEVVS